MRNIENNDAKQTILIVDDVPVNMDVLFRILDEENFKTKLATNGEDALRIAEEYLPDLILLDIMMPGINGFEVCKRLKSNAATQEIPVIFITALGNVDDKAKGLTIGAQDYITKPFQISEVLARVRIHLQLSYLQKELCDRNQALEQEIYTHKQTEQRLEHTSEQLKQRNAELDAFARTVAHDLKNPVSAISGLAQLALTQVQSSDFAKRDKVERNLQLIGQSGQQAFNIIEALLTLARTANEDVEVYPLDMAEVIERVLQRLQENIESRQATFEMPDEWPVAQGHSPWVEEVWFNYLSNALKYGGAPPRVKLSATQLANGDLRFEVRHNGPGLDPDAQSKLFRPFVRLHQQRAEGHGLGLTIVCQITRKLKGTAGVESQPGEGSCFYFTLPG